MSFCKGKNIVVILTGSIACYKAATLISRLVQAGAKVKTVTTRSALKFLGEATLEGLTGNKNLSDTFEAGEVMEHIHLARWADHMIVYPCTANFMAQWAGGLAQDLASTLMVAKTPEIPVSFAPAMNGAMWDNPITQSNVQKVLLTGARMLSPDSGGLACGETGAGRLMEPEVAFETLSHSFLKKGSVLVTYGGTIEPIDQVRGITNFSTGSTGQWICEQLSREGYEVTTVRAARAPGPLGVFQDLEFTDFKSLASTLRQQLKNNHFDSVIHLAAVSDFSVDKVVDGSGQPAGSDGKISSNTDLSIHLKKNFKIIDHLKSWSANKHLQVIGFKLTVNADKETVLSKVSEVLKSGCVDYVVQNELSSVSKEHAFQIFNINKKMIRVGEGKPAMAADLIDLINQPKQRQMPDEVTL